MMKKLSAALLSLALLIAPAHGANQASVQTPTTGPHSATDFTTNFLNPALLALFTCNWGPGAPANGAGGVANNYQCWANTTTNPVVFNYHDGTSWVAFGKLDTTAHTWTPVRQGTDLGTASTATTGTSGHTIPFLDGTNAWSGTNTGGTWSGASHIALTALGIRSTGAAFDVRFASSEVLTADRTLTWVLGDASRSITLNGNLSIGGALTFSGAFSFTGTLTGTTTVTFPTTGTLATLAGSETFTNKTFVCANQTSCVVRLGSDVTGTLLAGNFPALLGDVTTSAGSLTTVVGNLPTGVTAAGSILHTNIAAPGSPAAGKNSIWTDSTDLRFHDKNSAGVIGTTVVADTGAANNFLTAISAAGVISKSTIACAGLSDDGPFCNGTDAANLTGTVANARLTGSYTGVTGLGTVTTGSWQATVIGLAFGGSGQTTALAARGSSGFNIDEATSTGDANYTILASDRMVYHTALSAPRTDTLPAANAVNAGQIFVINDFRGVASGTNTVTLARAGADTINGVTSVVAISAQYGAGIYWSDGVSRWTFFPGGAAGSGTVTQVVCGTGLTGGTITSTGTCAISAPVSTANGGTGVVSPTANTIPINQGASAQTNTGTGTKGQCLISNGAGVDPSFTSGCRVLLNTMTASNSASLDDTTSLTSAYDDYEIVFENLLPATNNTGCMLRVHNAGAFVATSYVASNWSFNGSALSSATQTTNFPCSAQNAALSSTAPGLSGTIRIFGPVTSTTKQKLMTAYMTQGSIGGGVGGSWNNNAAIDGFQVLMIAGNITSGVVKVYGMK